MDLDYTGRNPPILLNGDHMTISFGDRHRGYWTRLKNCVERQSYSIIWHSLNSWLHHAHYNNFTIISFLKMTNYSKIIQDHLKNIMVSTKWVLIVENIMYLLHFSCYQLSKNWIINTQPLSVEKLGVWMHAVICQNLILILLNYFATHDLLVKIDWIIIPGYKDPSWQGDKWNFGVELLNSGGLAVGARNDICMWCCHFHYYIYHTVESVLFCEHKLGDFSITVTLNFVDFVFSHRTYLQFMD